jgi:holo-ACP synthase
MAFNLLLNGTEVQLEDMLAAREKRAAKQLELLQRFPSQALLVATLNIPGPIKHVTILDEVFRAIRSEIHMALEDLNPTSSHYAHALTGQEYYLTVPAAPGIVKELMVAIEEHHPYGRIVDLDVLYLNDGQLRGISRRDLGLPTRRCYLCGEDAKVCGRSRAHSIVEIQQKITKIILFNR